MTRLEDLKPGLQLQGIVPQQLVTIVDVKWYGTAAVELTYKRADCQTGNQLLYPEEAAPLVIVVAEQRWDYSADGNRLSTLK